jgi:hypothetical protein
MDTEPVQEPVPAQTTAQQREFIKVTAAADCIQRIIQRVQDFMAEAQESYEYSANTKRSDSEMFAVGGLV